VNLFDREGMTRLAVQQVALSILLHQLKEISANPTIVLAKYQCKAAQQFSAAFTIPSFYFHFPYLAIVTAAITIH
jgi:hypothetical protein